MALIGQCLIAIAGFVLLVVALRAIYEPLLGWIAAGVWLIIIAKEIRRRRKEI